MASAEPTVPGLQQTFMHVQSANSKRWCFHAAFPFIVVNTLLGSYAAYGLAGLRNQMRAIIGFGGIMLLQSLIAIQVMVFSVYVTPNQVYSYFAAWSYPLGKSMFETR